MNGQVYQSSSASDSPSFAQVLNPVQMAKSLYVHRNLIKQFAWRDATGRYKGSFLGIVWSFLTPLMMLGVYTFVFGFVFQAKWGVPHETGGDFALTLFCGLIVFGIFSECVTRAPGLILGYANYVKKVVFPLEIFPVAALGSSLINGAMSLCVLAPLALVWGSDWPTTIYLFPLVLIPLCALTLGLTWFLASTGVFVRDIAQPVSVIVTVLLFMSGVFFPISTVPSGYQVLLKLNPLVHILEDARRTLLWGKLPDWRWWTVTTLLALIVMQLGYGWFIKSKRAFADVM
jgi:lipopolysaccharide transport system permease protein